MTKYIPDIKDCELDSETTFLLIGDLHFQPKNLSESKEFIDKTLKVISKEKPDYVVLMGDILHTNADIKLQCYHMAFNFIKDIHALTNLYILIGNHDMINHVQYRTDVHMFNSFKYWSQEPHQLVVVDDATELNIGDKTFIFCPYVPKGRFIELLDETHPDTWKSATAIFAHQDFLGCRDGAYTSEDGDSWNEKSPLVFSGHIHESQRIGKNIFYTGSARQNDFGDMSPKRLWLVKFNDSQFNEKKSIKKIDLKMKVKRVITIKIENINDSIPQDLLDCDLKIILIGTAEQHTVFRKSERYRQLIKDNIKISLSTIDRVQSDKIDLEERQIVSFDNVFSKIVLTKGKKVQKEYGVLKDMVAI